MVKENKYCKKCEIDFRWGYLRAGTETEVKENGPDFDLRWDTPKTETNWKEAELLMGENSFEMAEVTEVYDNFDLCEECRKYLREQGFDKQVNSIEASEKERDAL